ncbi:MAG TPA: RraA family protein [Verrucomicrobiae bacterium]|jgi:regulator of RNase E activity RraA|nr:RraA family protein [Verrucomicrobiae bacterium]
MDELVSRLAKLDTCAASDALDRLGLRGATIGIRPVWPCARIVGRAVTCKIKPAGLEKSKVHLGTPAIEAAKPSDIIVVDNGGRPDVSAWGGLLSLASKQKGLSGVVIDGACRDVDESRDVGFPVYARAVVPVTARGRIMQDSINQEIQCGGVQVHPGDLVIADGSGVVIIPSSRAQEVVSEAEKIAAHEAKMAEAVRSGRSVVEVMETLGYESMLHKER